MPQAAAFKKWINGLLSLFNLQVETLTARQREEGRLGEYYRNIGDNQPIYPTPAGFRSAKHDDVLSKLYLYKKRFESFLLSETNDVGFCLENDYFSSPDAEVLYTILVDRRPRTYIEVGSGNSTRVARQAVMDHSLAAKIVSIDPCPRADVEGMCDESHGRRAEQFAPSWFAERLNPGDILFVDSSHEVKTGNDVVFLLLKVIPLLRKGVIVHIHDIFLPFEYPSDWVVRNGWGWNEQYLVQALLMGNVFSKVIWAARYAQQEIDCFDNYFDYAPRPLKAQSLWVEV